ncbi:MAG: glutathione S-transferase family protein [Pseudomonadota bacterium]
MQLYYSPGAISVASAVALYEAGVEFEPIRVDFAAQAQQSDAYLALNPKGRVPTLITPHGPLTETIAILEYACPGLIPADPWDQARMREVNTYLASTMHVAHAHRFRGARWADDPAAWEAMTAKVPETMTDSAAYMEAKIEGPFILGPTLTLSDPYFYAIARWLAWDGVDMAKFPKITAFLEMMEARPSVIRAHAEGLIQ